MSETDVCRECGRELRPDESALYRRMVDRRAQSLLCIDCLAAYFGVSRAALEQKIVQYKEVGCTLFQ